MANKVKINSRELAIMDESVKDSPHEWTFPVLRLTMTGEVQPPVGGLTGWSQNIPPKLRKSKLLNGSALTKLSYGLLKR
jgi:hypothetical protein